MGVFGTAAAIADIFMYKSSIKTVGGSQVTEKTIEEGTISLKNVDFSYPTKKEIKILDKVSIEIGKNRTIALVGTSGCGKSTII